jgi:Secretin and TonB N terminus short domain
MFARWSVFALLGMGLLTSLTAAHAADVTYAFNIPEEALADTLRSIGHETTMNIVFAPETVDGARAPAIQGQLTIEQAVSRALSRTKLQARKATASSILIEPLSSSSTKPGERFVRVSGQKATGDDPPDDQAQAKSAASVTPASTMS